MIFNSYAKLPEGNVNRILKKDIASGRFGLVLPACTFALKVGRISDTIASRSFNASPSMRISLELLKLSQSAKKKNDSLGKEQKNSDIPLVFHNYSWWYSIIRGVLLQRTKNHKKSLKVFRHFSTAQSFRIFSSAEPWKSCGKKATARPMGSAGWSRYWWHAIWRYQKNK